MEQEQDKEIKHQFVETYAEDMAKVIENGQEGGIIKKIIHEEEEHEIEKKNQSPETKKNKLFMLVGLLCIALGFSTLFYFFSKENAPAVLIAPQFTPIIFSDKNSLIEVAGLTKDQIIEKVRSGVEETSVKNGGVEGIYLTLDKSPVGLRKFIEIINGNLVLDSNNFIEDNFLMGVVNSETNSSSAAGGDFFMILKMRSTADIFDALRASENKMFSDLGGFFGASLTPDTKYLLNANFTDGIVQNKNARILYDQDGNIVMMYIFADDNSVIITNTESAAQEIMTRLAASQIKK